MRLAARLAATRLAQWCLQTGRSVEEYRTLTRLERDEFTRIARKTT